MSPHKVLFYFYLLLQMFCLCCESRTIGLIPVNQGETIINQSSYDVLYGSLNLYDVDDELLIKDLRLAAQLAATHLRSLNLYDVDGELLIKDLCQAALLASTHLQLPQPLRRR